VKLLYCAGLWQRREKVQGSSRQVVPSAITPPPPGYLLASRISLNKYRETTDGLFVWLVLIVLDKSTAG
jgi:hypothetical protein